MRTRRLIEPLGLVFSILLLTGAWANAADTQDFRKFIQVSAKTKEERSALADLGMSIEFIRSDSVWGFADPFTLDKIKGTSQKILGVHDFSVGRGGHASTFDFPNSDARYHNYDELYTKLKLLRDQNADIVTLSSIGKTIENRDIWALHINTDTQALQSGQSNKPGVVYMGTHHAREHLSTEIPLMFAEHLLKNRAHPEVSGLLDTRDIWIIPLVNADGSEWDISTGRYKMWRKNRRRNNDGTYGVDLNRNYGYQWGTGGSSNSPSSDVYMGTSPFSEPETQAIRDFIDSHTNTAVLLSFHTFSELILYPWGHSYDPVGAKAGKVEDREVFETMAKQMAKWNGYTPQQSSDLYIASGDTVDWAYGEHGIFAFTFELSPKSMWTGGFYPGAGVIDKVFNDNLKPCMYLLEVADDPYKVTRKSAPWWSPNWALGY